MGAEPDSAMLMRIRERLEDEMNRVREEIRRYPFPIPACDAQYNHLLESREALSMVLARVRDLRSDNAPTRAGLSIDDFLDASTDMDDTLKSEIRTIIENEARAVESR